MTQKVLVFGKHGQVGSALAASLGERGLYLGRTEADLSQPEKLAKFIEQAQPTAIINAAAYTKVDKAEEEEALAYTINAQAPEVMAEAAKTLAIPFVHISTDYVFDGSGNTAWKETDPTAPLNAYGRTKRAGEEKIEAVGGKYAIFRTSWVFDASSPNFLTTMLRLGREREELRIVSDQVGAPTYAPHLAAAIVQSCGRITEGNAGIYHLCNGGETNWFAFAQAIFANARQRGMELKVQQVLPISSKDYPTPAIRPHNSRLDCLKAQQAFGIQMSRWEEGLREAIMLIKQPEAA